MRRGGTWGKAGRGGVPHPLPGRAEQRHLGRFDPPHGSLTCVEVERLLCQWGTTRRTASAIAVVSASVAGDVPEADPGEVVSTVEEFTGELSTSDLVPPRTVVDRAEDHPLRQYRHDVPRSFQARRSGTRAGRPHHHDDRRLTVVYLSKLPVNMCSREFRRDHADIHQMHRTVMRAFRTRADDSSARHSHGALWRMDPSHRGFVCYVQSRSAPDWATLPADYLLDRVEVRDLSPLLERLRPGRRFAFRLVGNPTRIVRTPEQIDMRARGKRVPLGTVGEQVEWLVRKGEQHGFVVPTGANGQPDVAPSPCPAGTGDKRSGRISVVPVRFDGHLVVTDAELFTEALRSGIGRAKAYGCGLVSLAPPR
ncbi:CRISPR-associated protein Cas6/Cse3/CasE subtype I-E [Crossiella equi]|uniref:CRISPR-associated protein Cas6/Cse3/CasE subtype I-E n=3 Tax=Crossiella equi TaxID=130796 RepID=A0ABS5APV7_9PSEU|nr:type I-E CRISPR-associated protein Cas6/Cse3/CasE [Crossiella equi]MBP2478593.1 CRISPR-associated protein Cas6/Cse3/CasE subtype I-E [Crossiella equi]